jgi:flagellar biosynthesis protein FlhB
MAEDRDQERSLPASQRRLDEARERGEVARSRELSTCLVLATGAMGLARNCLDLVRRGLSWDLSAAHDTDSMATRLHSLSADALVFSLPLFALLLLASVLGPLAIGGWVFSVNALAPALSRLNPLSGLSRIFSLHGLAELIKALGKALLVGGIGAWVIWTSLAPIAALSDTALDAGIASFLGLMQHGLFILVAALAVVALFDVPFQLYQYHSRLRMTPQEAKREAREAEGDPLLKARIRAQQRDIARRRMMSQVPKADVVVTNPTHYAVALKYSDSKMRAPKVIAKGADAVAQRIREVARQHDVPTVEAPALTRALFRHVNLEQEIPQILYAAVAQVLAYVFQLQNYRRLGGTPPSMTAEVLVPPELDIQGSPA